jgi:hypothetical protein
MNLQYLRSSSINTYDGCEFQYFMEYNLGLKSKSGRKAVLGTIIHHVLELMARAKKLNKTSGKFLDPDFLLEICWQRYEKEEADNIEFTKRDYNFCKRTINKVLGTKYDPKNLNVLATEKRFQIPMKMPGFTYSFFDLNKKENVSGNFELRGTADLVTEVDKDTLEIIDWKTGSRKCWNTGQVKDYGYLSSKDVQLRVYDLAMSIVYPEYKNRILTIHYINDGGPFSVVFDDQDRKETINLLKSKINNIENNWLPCRLKENKPSESRWKCKNVCYFGKTKGSNGNCICDNMYYYMLNNGIDSLEKKVFDIKSEQSTQENKTSDRRNVY